MPFDEVEARRESSMRSARLEAVLLQTILNYVASEKLLKEEVIMALLNATKYWQHKLIREKLRRLKGGLSE